ncbi:hypothetical protein JKF63_02323 [Porcisia hertigi]|uniref:Uncharacterized protein n=1 Tax=Porcisia hertigi TaxID=2761500 RepID=A0A836IIF7_9TRYP|nr:hypothetical protein JKF63_02323 [Porcisia hertigi]
MYYEGYDQGYGGNQTYAGDFGNSMYDCNYQPQQMVPSQGDAGYNAYEQGGAYQQLQQRMSGMVGGAGYAHVGGNVQAGYPESSGYAQDHGQQRVEGVSTNLKSSKSFTGPPPGVERQQSSMARSRSVASRSGRGSDTGMARHGSIFFSTRERDTQVAISTRGGMSALSLDEDESDLKQFYGDMAGRSEERHMDGLKAVRSYRGDIEDGEDIGKPRRVTNRRNVDGRSATGYGGINFKRKVAMRNGEQWGKIELRETPQHNGDHLYGVVQSGGRRPPINTPNMSMVPTVFQERSVMPQIYRKGDVNSYSNMSDAFAEAQTAQAE